jgi:hypothetical protein
MAERRFFNLHTMMAKAARSPLLKEKRFYLRDFARQIDPRVAYNTVLEWHRDGRVNRGTGRRVHLKAIRATNGLQTSLEEYNRFIAALNE